MRNARCTLEICVYFNPEMGQVTGTKVHPLLVVGTVVDAVFARENRLETSFAIGRKDDFLEHLSSLRGGRAVRHSNHNLSFQYSGLLCPWAMATTWMDRSVSR